MIALHRTVGDRGKVPRAPLARMKIPEDALHCRWRFPLPPAASWALDVPALLCHGDQPGLQLLRQPPVGVYIAPNGVGEG